MSRNSVDRRSVYIDYASSTLYPSHPVDNAAFSRARSLCREQSLARIHRLDNVDCAYYHNRIRTIERDMNESAVQLDTVNKSYHDMHANFLSRQVENKYYIGAIEEHVVDQNVQLNRILTLLEQEEFELRKRLNFYRSKSRRRIRPVSSYRPSRDFDNFANFEVC